MPEMILHKDRYFEHLYQVRFDLLCIKWPTIEGLYLPEILNSIRILIENIKNYNIRHLLVDASATQAHSSQEDADKVVSAFISGLQETRIEKIARIESTVQERENQLKERMEEVNRTNNFEIRFFKDEASALKWMQSHSNGQ